MDHGILAADLVRRDRQILANLLRVADDVQERGRRLHHDDVRALLDVALDGAARQAPAAGGQLVAAAVAEGGGAAGGVAEGPVQAAGELGGVGHEGDLVGDAGLDELELDGAHAAVVHVGGGDAVRAGQGVGHGDVADALDGHGVVEGAVVAQDAAVPVGRVLAETHVADYEEGGEGFAEEADALDYGALGVVGCGAEGVFGVGAEGNAEEDDGFETLGDEGREEGDESVEADAGLVW